MEERRKILDNLVGVSNNEGDIAIESISLEFSPNKYSAKKNSIYHIVLNGKHLSKKNTYSIKYRCVSCESIHVVGTTQFLRKINKCSYRCNLCVNKDEVKRSNHSLYLLTPERLSMQDLKNQSEALFDEYDDDFKSSYYSSHLSSDDYKRLSKSIISLQNGKHKVQDLEFWPVFKTNNQMLFSSVFYDKLNDLVIKANQPVLQCENCNAEWRAKTLDRFKNCHKILCPSCNLCNNTFKIRRTKNCINEMLLYQSKLEMKFINWCNNNSIVVKNGPTIPYVFEGKSRKCRVDFLIKDTLIEIKDNHRNDVKSREHSERGKNGAVMEAIRDGKYKEYYLITPDIWIYTLNKIKQDLNKI